MESNKDSFLLRYAARKAAQNSFFLSEYLNEFRIIQGMAEDELARFLGCSPRLLPKLALCRRPDTESPRFRSDVEQIAVAFDVLPSRLVQLIREVDIVKALAKGKPKWQEAPEGLLAVARDDEDSQSEPGDIVELPNDEENK